MGTKGHVADTILPANLNWRSASEDKRAPEEISTTKWQCGGREKNGGPGAGKAICLNTSPRLNIFQVRRGKAFSGTDFVSHGGRQRKKAQTVLQPDQ